MCKLFPRSGISEGSLLFGVILYSDPVTNLGALSRQVPGFPIYGVGQPTEEAFPLVIEKVLAGLYPGRKTYHMYVQYTVYSEAFPLVVEKVQ